jgi:hypothetical protein
VSAISPPRLKAEHYTKIKSNKQMKNHILKKVMLLFTTTLLTTGTAFPQAYRFTVEEESFYDQPLTEFHSDFHSSLAVRWPSDCGSEIDTCDHSFAEEKKSEYQTGSGGFSTA